MSSGAVTLQTPDNEGTRRQTCPLYGCKRVYTNAEALDRHTKDHAFPTESAPGKAMRCSTLCCSSSFPDMQKLMEHMRHHHKPNIFFLCENCRAKLRSYHGLLTHLHTCSKVPRGKQRTVEPMEVQPLATLLEERPGTSVAAGENLSAEQVTLLRGTASACVQVASQIRPVEPALAALSQPDSTAANLQASVCSSNPGCLSVQQLQTSDTPLSPCLDTRMVTGEPPMGQGEVAQSQAPVSSPQTPPCSTAVWKKNQGLAGHSRILWQHNRGRYRCVQCGHSVSSKEMTAHINAYHRGSPEIRPTDDLDHDRSVNA